MRSICWASFSAKYQNTGAAAHPLLHREQHAQGLGKGERRLHGQRRIGSDNLRDFDRTIEMLARRNDLTDQAQFKGGVGPEPFGSQKVPSPSQSEPALQPKSSSKPLRGRKQNQALPSQNSCQLL